MLILVWGLEMGTYLSDLEDVVLGLLWVEMSLLLRLI